MRWKKQNGDLREQQDQSRVERGTGINSRKEGKRQRQRTPERTNMAKKREEREEKPPRGRGNEALFWARGLPSLSFSTPWR